MSLNIIANKNIDTGVANELTLRDAYAPVNTARGVLSYTECNCTKIIKNNASALLSRILSIVN